MSAAMLVRRQALVAGASRSSVRSGAAVRHPKPFTPARKVFVSRAQPEEAEEAAEAAMLLEGEDAGDLEALVFDEEDNDQDGDDNTDVLAAIKVAQEFSHYEDHLVVEASIADELKAAAGAEDDVQGLEAAEEGDGTVADEEDDVVEGAAEVAFERLLTGSSTAHDEDTLMAFVGAEAAAEVEDLQDVQGPRGFRKYDEQEHSGISEEDRAAMADAKLTREELANLVPEDWDTINIDWFSNKREDNIALPEYRLNFIWAERNIAVAVDQVYSRGQVSPLTEYFFWPRKDAWDELRMALEARPWIPERDKIILLNRTTEVINTWQAEGDARPSLDVVRADFPDCTFMGTSTPAPPPPPPAFVPDMAVSA